MRRYTAGTAVLEVGMIVLAVLFCIPILVLINTALMPTGAMSDPLTPVPEPTLANFAGAWVRGGLGGAMVNNLVVTVVSVVLIITIASLAAYPLARSTRGWSRGMLAFFMAGLLVPMLLSMIPLYVTFRDLDLLGNIWALCIIYVGAQLPFSIFLYTQFIRALPTDYEEAALIDGAGPFRSFVQVVFPLLRPITGTVAILNAVFVWNDFFTPLLYLAGTDQVTISIALYSFTGIYASEWNTIFAGLIIGSIPVIAFYLFTQRHIIKGFSGGLKG
ncbi:carbohydrate ABC transporter permease [Propionibacteriaceae bacterium Y2011]